MGTNKVILNSGDGAWIFQDLAENLASNLKIEISDVAGDFNYVLSCIEVDLKQLDRKMFIPYEGIKLASDKRLLANKFLENNIATPETYLLDTHQEVVNFISDRSSKQWCLKYPIGCGGSGHRKINYPRYISQTWPKPYVVQKFIKLKKLQVFRLYCAGGILFGWNRRKFISKDNSNPWVAHANGAIYEILGEAPDKLKSQKSKVKSQNLSQKYLNI